MCVMGQYQLLSLANPTICQALTQNRKRKEVFARTGKDQERKKGGSWKERRELMGEKTEERKVEAREMNVE